MALESDDLTRQRGAYTNLGTQRRDAGFSTPTGGVDAAKTISNVTNQTQQTMLPPNNLGYPGYAEQQAGINDYLARTQGRVAPQSDQVTMAALAQSGQVAMNPFSSANYQALGPAQFATAAKAGPAAFGPAGRAAAGQLGPAAQAEYARIDPLARAADSDLRAQQVEALNYQGGLMRGENSVAKLQGQRMAEEANARALSMARSGRPGMGAVNMRNALNSQARAEGDISGRTQEAMLAERNAAGGLYGNMAAAARGQDLSLNTFNTGQENQRALAQAGFQQGANLQNAQQTNQQSQVGAGLQTQASIANANNQTQMGVAQGQMAGQIGMFNAGQQNQMGMFNSNLGSQRDMFNADLGSRTSMFNSGQQNQYNMFGADLAQRNNQFNTGEANRYNMYDAGMRQQNNQFNVGSQLQQMGLNDSAWANAMGQQFNRSRAEQDGGITAAQLAMQKYNTDQNIKAQLEMNRNNNSTSWTDRLWGMGTTLAGAGLGFALGGPAGAAAGGSIGSAFGSSLGGGSGFAESSGGWQNPYQPAQDFFTGGGYGYGGGYNYGF